MGRLHRQKILDMVESKRKEIVLCLQELIRVPSLPGEEGMAQKA